MNYAIRFSFPYDKVAAWCSRVSMVSQKVCFYEHAENAANVHVHGLLMGVTKDKSTLKNWFKETLGLAPARTQWVFSQVQKDGSPLDEGFLAYMSKGKYDPKYNKGFTDDEIACAKAKGYDRPDRASVKVSKNDQYYKDFVDYVKELGEERLLDSMHNDGKFCYVRRKSFRFMMQKVGLPMPHNIALHKACVMKYCFENDIPLPVKRDVQNFIYGL